MESKKLSPKLQEEDKQIKKEINRWKEKIEKTITFNAEEWLNFQESLKKWKGEIMDLKFELLLIQGGEK